MHLPILVLLAVSAVAVASLLWLASKNAAEERAEAYESLGRAMIDEGAAYVGLSESDGRAIGVNPSKGTVILGFLTADGVRTAEYPLGDIRDASWSIEGYTLSQPMGFVGFSQASAIRAANREALLQARAASGLSLELADVERPGVLINLDADEGRLRRCMEILTQAFEGRLPVPSRPISI